MKMNRRPMLYAIVFLGVFTLIDRFIFIPFLVGGLFWLGILLFFCALLSDYWFLALARDSNIRIGITGLKNFTTIGPPEKRKIGHCGPLYDSKNQLAYPPIGFYPRGGLSSDFFLPLQGGGRKGYDLIPDWAIWEHTDGGHQIVIAEPYRVTFESLPQEWKDILKRDKKFVEDAPIYYYGHIPSNIKKMVIPRQIYQISNDIKIGDARAQVAFAEERNDELTKENERLKARILSLLTIEERGHIKQTFSEKVKRALLGEEDENEPDRFEGQR